MVGTMRRTSKQRSRQKKWFPSATHVRSSDTIFQLTKFARGALKWDSFLRFLSIWVFESLHQQQNVGEFLCGHFKRVIYHSCSRAGRAEKKLEAFTVRGLLRKVTALNIYIINGNNSFSSPIQWFSHSRYASPLDDTGFDVSVGFSLT